MFHLGNKTRDLDFKFGDNTHVKAGCAALFKDKMMYFGGSNKQQVSEFKIGSYGSSKFYLGKPNQGLSNDETWKIAFRL